ENKNEKATKSITNSFSIIKGEERRVYRNQIYEAFLNKWMKQKRMIESADISEIWSTGEKIAVKLYSSGDTSSKKAEVDLGKTIWKFDFQQGKYILIPSEEWKNIWSDSRIQYLPLQNCGVNRFKFFHLSIQEYLLSRYLYHKLNNCFLQNSNEK